MPIYLFECRRCGLFEAWHSIHKQDLRWCPNCPWYWKAVNFILGWTVRKRYDYATLGIRGDYFHNHPYWSDNLSPDGLSQVYVDSNRKYNEFRKKVGVKEGRMNKDHRIIENSRKQMDEIKQRGDKPPQWLVNQATETREY